MTISDSYYVPLPKNELIQFLLLIDGLKCHLHWVSEIIKLKDETYRTTKIQRLIKNQNNLVKEVDNVCYRQNFVRKIWDMVSKVGINQ